MMTLTTDDPNFTRRVGDAIKRLDRNLRTAMELSGDIAVNEARVRHGFKSRSGDLVNSMQAGDVRGSWSGHNLRIDLVAGVKYGIYVMKGTKPHVIRAKYRKALRWSARGGFRFAKSVKHPGTKPQPFFEKAVERKGAKIDRTLLDAVALSFSQAGFAIS